MTQLPRIGFAGVGLMGHGAAKNIVEKGGYKLTVLGHRNRQPVDDLVKRGASEATDVVRLADASDIVFLCLPSSIEVEALVYGEGGLLGAMRKGMILVDCTTADPTVTRRIGADLQARGCSMIDAPMGRTPKEAEEGRLATYLGGDAETIARVRPVLETYADTIVVCGGLGAGTTCKLVNNCITIGTCAIISEALTTASKLGVDMNALCDVLSAGGANGKMWQMMMPWIREGDDSHLKGPLRIAAKDMRFYNRMAEAAGVATFIAQAVNQTYRLALNEGHGERFMPVLPDVLADLNGTKIRGLGGK